MVFLSKWLTFSCARDTGEPASIPPPSPSTPKATCATFWGGPAAARVDAGREAPAWPCRLRTLGGAAARPEALAIR